MGARPTIPEGSALPEAAVALIKSCWHADPEKRPTFLQVLAELKKLAATN
jgi:hypothetical protein